MDKRNNSINENNAKENLSFDYGALLSTSELVRGEIIVPGKVVNPYASIQYNNFEFISDALIGSEHTLLTSSIEGDFGDFTISIGIEYLITGSKIDDIANPNIDLTIHSLFQLNNMITALTVSYIATGDLDNEAIIADVITYVGPFGFGLIYSYNNVGDQFKDGLINLRIESFNSIKITDNFELPIQGSLNYNSVIGTFNAIFSIEL